MKKRTLFLLIALLLLSACGKQTMLETRPEKVNQTAAAIINFELPTGFGTAFAASVDGYSIVAYSHKNQSGHLYLIQSQNDADFDLLEQEMNKYVAGSGNVPDHRIIVETLPVHIDDQSAEVVISEDNNGDGQRYRQALVAFEGKGGPALLVFSTLTNDWDTNTLNALLESLNKEDK